jgi:DNA sulfur modification protein DndE
MRREESDLSASFRKIDSDKDAQAADGSGFEITRSTLFGDNEAIYKYCMGIRCKDKDDVFFPHLTGMHIERGLVLLEREYKLAGNKEKFLKTIINKIDFAEK